MRVNVFVFIVELLLSSLNIYVPAPRMHLSLCLYHLIPSLCVYIYILLFLLVCRRLWCKYYDCVCARARVWCKCYDPRWSMLFARDS